MHTVDEVAAELYTTHPTRFVAARDAAARRARQAGDRAAATEIGRLRRPTIAAWAVNLLVRSVPEAVDELWAVGRELREAQRTPRPEPLRQLTLRRRGLIGALVRQARQRAADAGHPLSDAASAEVERTLAAALADPGMADLVASGRLLRPLEHIGLGMPPPAQPTQTTSEAPTPPLPEPTPAEPTPADGVPDQLALQRRRREERAARDLARISQELAEATARAEHADEQVRITAERFADAERRLAALRDERDQAQRDHAEAQQRARSAARVREEIARQARRLIARQAEG